MNNRISIILPTHNGAKYLRQSIDSCLSQTYGNLELIIVDDASTDETPSIIRSYNDPRMKVITQTVNKKLPASLNAGFAASTGEYLTWASDDNYYASNAIETMAGYLDKNDKIDFVYSNYRKIDANNAPLGSAEVANAKDLFFQNCIGACFLYRRIVYEKTGNYDESLFLEEDYDYWFRVRSAFKMKRIPDYLCYYRVHPTSLTNIYSANHNERLQIVRNKHLKSWEKYCYYAIEGFNNGNMFNAVKFSVLSFLLNPFQLYPMKVIFKVFFEPKSKKVIKEIVQ